MSLRPQHFEPERATYAGRRRRRGALPFARLLTQQRFDPGYFEHSCGPLPYERSHVWLSFFGHVADLIVERAEPQTVLDAGCAMGFLVEALRDRGVDAYGVDVSKYAIGEVRDDVKPYCRVASLTEPFPRDYDLITCIEVLEHLTPEEGEQALDNICAHTSTVLFSSTRR